MACSLPLGRPSAECAWKSAAMDVLPNEACKHILSHAIKPFFKRQAYFAGLDRGTDEVMTAISPAPPLSEAPPAARPAAVTAPRIAHPFYCGLRSELRDSDDARWRWPHDVYSRGSSSSDSSSASSGSSSSTKSDQSDGSGASDSW